MPIETAAVNGVRPVARPQAPGGVDGVNRRDGESTPSGFRPQTNVSIENAVSDMAGILSKISSEEMENVEKMPQDLQKVIENVMKQAFSFNQTLAEGLGSTMESQRFSMEQLTTVARTLMQMSALAEKGYDVNISDGLQMLLTNLKAAVTQEAGGNAFEPVLLLKASFDLINGKDPQDLPAALQQLLTSMQTAGGQGQAAPASDTMGFLKQLVQYFMPRSDAGAESGVQMAGQSAAQEGQAAQGQTTAQTTQQGMAQAGQTAQGQQTQNGGIQQDAQEQTATGNAARTSQTATNVQQGGTVAGQPRDRVQLRTAHRRRWLRMEMVSLRGAVRDSLRPQVSRRMPRRRATPRICKIRCRQHVSKVRYCNSLLTRPKSRRHRRQGRHRRRRRVQKEKRPRQASKPRAASRHPCRSKRLKCRERRKIRT